MTVLTRSPAWLWGPVAVHMGLTFYFSSLSVLPTPSGLISDKWEHALSFGLLSALVLRALAKERLSGVTLARAAFAAVIATAYGASDEWHQAFVPSRTSELADLVADATGAVAVAAAILGVRYNRAVFAGPFAVRVRPLTSLLHRVNCSWRSTICS